MQLIYKGVDITSKVQIVECVHDSYAEAHGDTVKITLVDQCRLWDKWGPQVGDELRVKHGSMDSGIMFVKDAEPGTGCYILRASSLPMAADSERSNAWEQITFLSVAAGVAGNLGLSLKTFGAKDRVYKYLRQRSERDIDFLQNLCVLQGCAFLVYNKQLILYGLDYMERQAAKQTANLNGDSCLHFKSSRAYSGCAVGNGKYSATASTNVGYTSVTERALDMYMSGSGEAMDYARNILRHLNKNKKSGYFYISPIAEGYSACSVININSAAASSFNGKVFLTHVRHDYQKGYSKIFFRVP